MVHIRSEKNLMWQAEGRGNAKTLRITAREIRSTQARACKGEGKVTHDVFSSYAKMVDR